jgi:ABC-type multidrug transport system fused ATPase/permease subunit
MKQKEKTSKINEGNFDSLPFSKGNFMIMIAGVVLIAVGFFIMTLDKEEFGFGFLGITLGPVIAFIGFLVEFYAILKKKD